MYGPGCRDPKLQLRTLVNTISFAQLTFNTSLCEKELSQEQALAEQTHKASQPIISLLIFVKMYFFDLACISSHRRSKEAWTQTIAEGKDERCWPTWPTRETAQTSPAHRHRGGEGVQQPWRTKPAKIEQPFSMVFDSDLRNILLVTRSESNLLVCT